MSDSIDGDGVTVSQEDIMKVVNDLSETHAVTMAFDTMNTIQGEIAKLKDMNDDIEYAYKKAMLLSQIEGIKRFLDRVNVKVAIDYDFRPNGEEVRYGVYRQK